jgi:hypothetical protein
MIKDLNLFLKDITILKNYADLILFCNDEESIKAFDIWIATTLIAQIERKSRSSAFKSVSYKSIKELGLVSVMNYKNFYPRRNEFSKTEKN